MEFRIDITVQRELYEYPEKINKLKQLSLKIDCNIKMTIQI